MKILFITTLVFCITSTFGQVNRKLEQVSDSRLISLLNGLHLLSEKETSDLSIRVFELGNPSGSAGQGNCEITHNIYIAVSEYDEAPEQTLHIYGPLLNPKILGWTGQSSEQTLTLEFGPADSRKQVKLNISIAKLTVLK